MPIAALLTTAETAERLRVHPATLSRLVRTGKGPAPVRVGSKLLFDEIVLYDWLRAQTRNAVSHSSIIENAA